MHFSIVIVNLVKPFVFCRQLFFVYFFAGGKSRHLSLLSVFVNALDAYDHKLPSKP